MTMAVYDRDGGLEVELGEWPGNEMFVFAENYVMSVRGLVFGRQLFAAVAADRVVIGTTDSLTFEILGRDGTLQRLVRVDEPSRPVEPGAFETIRDDVADNASDDMRALWL